MLKKSKTIGDLDREREERKEALRPLVESLFEEESSIEEVQPAASFSLANNSGLSALAQRPSCPQRSVRNSGLYGLMQESQLSQRTAMGDMTRSMVRMQDILGAQTCQMEAQYQLMAAKQRDIDSKISDIAASLLGGV